MLPIASRRPLGAVAVLSAAALAAHAAQERETSYAERLTQHAQALLDAHGGKGLTFPFDDPERTFVDFFPAASGEMRGSTLGKMNLARRRATYAMLGEALSHEGYLTVQTIQTLEDELRMSGLDGSNRISDDYTAQLFGAPGDDAWTFKYEGHHLSVNATVAGGQVRMTPLFLGANPVEVRRGPRAGQRAFGEHQRIALELFEGLSAELRQEAHEDEAPPVGVVPRGELRAIGAATGIAAARMDDASVRRLAELCAAFVRPLRAEVSRDLLARTFADLDALRFLWRGAAERHAPHHFRIQSPALLVDFEMIRDGGQPDANHVHVLIRDVARDFGADLLAAHHAEDHGAAADPTLETETVLEAAERLRALADLRAIRNAAESFAINNRGRWPDSIAMLIQKDANGRAYLQRDDEPVDPWGHAYVYAPPAPGASHPSLSSLGADGAEGGEGPDADIVLDH